MVKCLEFFDLVTNSLGQDEQIAWRASVYHDGLN
jgi:hypothetical protein